MAKVGQETGDIFKTNGNKRCEINRELFLDKLKNELNKKEESNEKKG